MAKPNYRVKRYKSSERPNLRAVVNWKDSSGKRCRQFFATVKEAETFAQKREIELLNQGKEALDFPSWLRVMAQTCNQKLLAHGKSLADATEHYLAHLAREKASLPIETAYAEFYEGKKSRGVSTDYLAQIRSRMRRFIAAYPGRLVSSFTLQDCEQWLPTLNVGPIATNSSMLLLREFFDWAKERDYYTGKNPTARIELAKEIEKPVGILTPDELSRLLEAADTVMLAYVAIGAFAGLRTAELERLDWSEVDFEDGFIEVTAAKAKTAKRRLVKMQPCLRVWLEPVAKKSGRILSTETAHLAMVQLRARADVEHWPKNALRHSFASYHLARFKNAAELALEMGHTGTGLIFQHYRQVVRESDALRYWNIVPEQPENVLRFAQQNTVPFDRRAKRTDHSEETGRFSLTWPRMLPYQKTSGEYAAQYGVTVKAANHYMRLGKPLDDPEAMERLEKRIYAMTIKEHAEAYGATPDQVKLWRRFGWPLDNVEAVRAYLGHRVKSVSGRFKGAANKAAKVIGLSARDALRLADAHEERAHSA